MHSSYAIHEAFSLSFAYFKTRLHILFWNLQTNQPIKGQFVTYLIILFFKMFSEHFLST